MNSYSGVYDSFRCIKSVFEHIANCAAFSIGFRNTVVDRLFLASMIVSYCIISNGTRPLKTIRLNYESSATGSMDGTVSWSSSNNDWSPGHITSQEQPLC